MKRPLVYVSLSYMFGIFLASSPSIVLMLTILLPLLITIGFIFSHRLPKFRIYWTFYIFNLAAFLIALIVVNGLNTSSKEDFEHIYGKKVKAEVQVVEVPEEEEDKTIYICKVLSVTLQDEISKPRSRVRLTVLNKGTGIVYPYGTLLKIEGKMNIPSQARNPGAFDYRQYLVNQGINAVMYLYPKDLDRIGEESGNPLITLGLQLRNRVVDVVNRCLPADQAGLLNGMLIGVKDGLNDRIKENFSNCGLAHLTAVSGMNVAFIIAPCLWLFKKIRISEKAASAITIPILIIFLFTTGISPSIFRAVIMGVVILISKIIDRDSDIITSIFFAALIILILNPYSLFDVGFQLSFAGTLSLVFLCKNLRSIFSFIPGIPGDVLAVSLAAQIGVTPITALYFNKVSLISLFSNLVAVPLVEGITIIGFLMSIFGQFWLLPARLAGGLNYFLLSIILWVTEISSRIPYNVINVVTPSISFLIIYYGLVYYFLWYLPGKAELNSGSKLLTAKNLFVEFKSISYDREKVFLLARNTILIFSLVLIIQLPGCIIRRDMEVSFLDVGQGDSIFIRTPERQNILIDGGGKVEGDKSSYDVGKEVVLPFLLDSGAGRIDWMIATHMHSDHTGGLLTVLENLHVGNLCISSNGSEDPQYMKVIAAAESKGVHITRVLRGDRIGLGRNAFLEILYPTGDDQLQTSENNRSIVARLVYNNSKILLSGDIEKEAEEDIVNSGIDITSDILKVPHHGSDTSSSTNFINGVNPKLSIISVGKNKFGHPSGEVLDRYIQRGIHVLRTDQSGGISLRLNGKNISLKETISKIR